MCVCVWEGEEEIRHRRIVLLKVAYYYATDSALENLPDHAKIMPEFPNCTPDFRNYAHKTT